MQPRERLTAKEMQVAVLVWEGQTNREIAKAIGTTEQVVKNYLRNTFDKLGVWSRLELAIYVARHGGEKWREEPVTHPIASCLNWSLWRKRSTRPNSRPSPFRRCPSLLFCKGGRQWSRRRLCLISKVEGSAAPTLFRKGREKGWGTHQ